MMAKVCEAKRKYWHELPLTKYKFYKIMLGDFEHRLRIPREFMENFRGEISQCCTLRGQSRSVWEVQVTKTKEDVLFTMGWENFVKDQAVRVYDFLVFSYAGDSSFEVFVFNATGCEREGSHFVKNMNLLGETSCGSILHRNDGNSSDDTIMPEKETDCSSEQEEVNDIHDHFSPQRRRRGTSRVLQRHKHYTSNRQKVTHEEKERAYKRATKYMSRSKSSSVPMVAITMLPTHVYRGFHMTIRKRWAEKYMLPKSHEVRLQVPGVQRNWAVRCSWMRSTRQWQIRAGWASFVLDNNLEEDDVCVFELVRRGRLDSNTMPVLNVHIFRVVEKVVPLIQSTHMV